MAHTRLLPYFIDGHGQSFDDDDARAPQLGLLLAHRQATKADQALTRLQRWALDVEQRTHHNKATIALSNKMARIIWVVWTRSEVYLAR